MKIITKLSLAAFAAISITAGAAFAGENTRWEYRFNAHGNRFLIAVPDAPTTVAVYGGRQGVGQLGAMQNERSEGRWEMRSNAHGDRFLIYVPNK